MWLCVDCPSTAYFLLFLAICSPIFEVHYRGYCYATLDFTNPFQAGEKCQDFFLPVPDEYSLVPFSEEIRANVVAAHQWETTCLVFEDGSAWWGAATADLTACGTNQLLVDRPSGDYRVRGCTRQILIRRVVEGKYCQSRAKTFVSTTHHLLRGCNHVREKKWESFLTTRMNGGFSSSFVLKVKF